jgi:hypothetical protein
MIATVFASAVLGVDAYRVDVEIDVAPGGYGKFNQTACLRDGIRHRRTMNEVTHEEGRAAPRWFQPVLPT